MAFVRLAIQSQRLILLVIALGLCVVAQRLDTCCTNAELVDEELESHAEADAYGECTSEESRVDDVPSTGSVEALPGDVAVPSHARQCSEPLESSSTGPEPPTQIPSARIGLKRTAIDENIQTEEIKADDHEIQTLVRIEVDGPRLSARPSTPVRHESSRHLESPGATHSSYLHATPGKDSGYGSSAESVADSENSPPKFRRSALVTRAVLQDSLHRRGMFREMLEMKEKKKALKQLLFKQPAWRGPGISLDRLDYSAKHRRFANIQILILDRQEGEHIPLSKALSLRDLRARTGLCVALFDTVHQKFVTELNKTVHNNSPFEKIEATVFVWCRTSKMFAPLGEMLCSPESRSSASLRIEHGERRPYVESSSQRLTSWSGFVNSTDIEEFYLSELHVEGVDIDVHMDCVLHPK